MEQIGSIDLLLIVGATVLFGAAAAFGGSPQPQAARPGQMSENMGMLTEVLKDIEYCNGGGKSLLMDILLPKKPSPAPRPAVLFLHGGGWENGDKEDHTVAALLASSGFVAATINYRLSGEATFPAAIEDSKCAVRYLRAQAARYGIDPERIGAMGSSAGGHLAMLVGCADEQAGLEGSGGWQDVSSRVKAVVSYFGPSDFTVEEAGVETDSVGLVRKFLGGTIEEKPELYRRASPITYISPGTPPLLMIHGDRDNVVPIEQSERMLRAYREVGQSAEMIRVEGAGHDFQPSSEMPNSLNPQEIDSVTVDFFKKSL